MTPNRRLDQLEPLMADSLQKIDRLIEGQGKLVDLATNTKNELDQVKKTGELTAKGLASLTISTKKQYDELKAGQDELRINQNLFQVGLDELRNNQNQFQVSQNELRTNQSQFQVGLDEVRANQDQLRAGLNAVMQYLKEKLP